VSRSVEVPTRERLSLGPASRLLGVDPDTLRRWADLGRIGVFTTPGGHRRFSRGDIDRLIAHRGSSAGRTPLSSLGATPDRLSRAYRRSYSSEGDDGATGGARDSVKAADREAFRTDGRGLVTSLLAYLDAEDPETREAAEAAATDLVDDLARRLAGGGLSLTESVGLFIAARRPFLAELGVVARRRALGSERVTAMFEEASGLLDRLLLRLIATHQEA
jgi:excisionase family DNA binding protein